MPGYHDFIIRTGGLQVFPRLVAIEHRSGHKVETLSSGLHELDALVGSEIRTGSSTLLIGPAGSGKSSIAASLPPVPQKLGEKALYYTFDELPEQMLLRAEGLRLDF